MIHTLERVSSVIPVFAPVCFSVNEVNLWSVIMGKSCKVVVCGQASVGKTAILEQLLYGNHVAGESKYYF